MQRSYYDAQAGKFLLVDPVAACYGPIGMFNHYKDANNNPYCFADPDGRCYTSAEKCMGESEFNRAWSGEPARVLDSSEYGIHFRMV